MRGGGQAFPHKFRIGRCLIPAYSRYWIIGLTLWISPGFPGCWARLTGLVHKLFQRFFPGEFSSVPIKFLVPVFFFMIAAPVDKFLELLIAIRTAINNCEYGSRPLF